jgi:hypothetical protein
MAGYDDFSSPIAQQALGNSASAYDAFSSPVEAKPEVNVAGEVTAPFAGFNKGVDATLNLPGTVMNLGARAINYGAEKLGYEPPLPDEPFKPVPVAANFNAGYEPQTAVGRYGQTIGEVAGAAVMPEAGLASAASNMTPAALRTAAPLFERLAAAGPSKALASGIVPTVGAGVGKQAARDADLGPVGELVGGLAGSIIAPAAYIPAARTAGGMKNAVSYANEQVRAAKNPEQSAINTYAKSLVEAKTPPEEIRGAVLQGANGETILSKELQARGINEANLAEIISRSMNGEDAAAIGADHGIAAGTVKNYVKLYRENNPTPMTIPDIVTELRGPGAAMPVLRRGRSAFGIAGDESADAAQTLFQRQQDQPGRTAGIIQKSAVGGERNFEQELRRLSTTAKQEANAAYSEAKLNAQPVKIDGVIDEFRARHPQEGGAISSKMNDAIDLFFKSGYTEGKGDNLRYTKALDVIDDVPSYLRRRRELDQMIAASYENNRPSPLTAELTEFRQAVNKAARSNNDLLRKADEKFAEDRTAERILERGQQLGKTLSPQTRQAMRDFVKMTPTQQELLRVAFEDKMASAALEKQDGVAAANQFSTPAFRRIVETFYPKSAGKEIYLRGRTMLRNLKREAISTATTNFQTGRGNSPTAPWTADIQSRMQGAQAAADMATGRFGKVLGNFSDWLARKIGQQAAQAELKIAAETDPAKILELANRLEAAANNVTQQDAILRELRQLRRPRLLRTDTAIGTATAAQNNDRKPLEVTIGRPASWPALPQNRLLGR